MSTALSFFVLFTLFIYIINLFFYARAWFAHREDKVYEHNSPKVSILVPIYNEELNIIETLSSITNQTYSNYEVIVINDGSTDKTVEKIINHFKLTADYKKPTKDKNNYKNIARIFSKVGFTLLDKENGGKADALNAGFAYCDGEYILSVDGDTLLDKRALEILVSKKRPDVDAVASMVGISNGNKIENSEIKNPIIPPTFWCKVQWMEYYRSYILLRNSLIDYSAITVIPGACSFISAEMISKTGGYKHNHLGEDMEHTLNIYRNGGKIQFLNEILSWTEAPENIRDLGKQRIRWFRGAIQSYTEYTDLIFNKRNKALGWVILPYVWISDIFGCWIELIGWCFAIYTFLVTNTYDYIFFMSLWLGIVLIHFSNFIVALLFIKKKLKLYENYSGIVAISLIEGFTFHYFYIYWILKAHVMEIFRIKRSWNKLERKGF